MEEFIISKENFNGLTCIWGRDKNAPTTMNSLMCYVYNNHTVSQNKVNITIHVNIILQYMFI